MCKIFDHPCVVTIHRCHFNIVAFAIWMWRSRKRIRRTGALFVAEANCEDCGQRQSATSESTLLREYIKSSIYFCKVKFARVYLVVYLSVFMGTIYFNRRLKGFFIVLKCGFFGKVYNIFKFLWSWNWYLISVYICLVWSFELRIRIKH